MSDKIIFTFPEAIDDNKEVVKIESRGYKKAIKSFQNKYPKLKIVDVWWVKDGKEIYKEQKLPMGRKKKLEG
jgi:hypothetical protein